MSAILRQSSRTNAHHANRSSLCTRLNSFTSTHLRRIIRARNDQSEHLVTVSPHLHSNRRPDVGKKRKRAQLTFSKLLYKKPPSLLRHRFKCHTPAGDIHDRRAGYRKDLSPAKRLPLTSQHMKPIRKDTRKKKERKKRNEIYIEQSEFGKCNNKSIIHDVPSFATIIT